MKKRWINKIKWDDSKENCPHCGANLQCDPIPKKSQHLFGATHGSRKIGIYDLDLDRTIKWKCPDCKGMWWK